MELVVNALWAHCYYYEECLKRALAEIEPNVLNIPSDISHIC